MGNGESVARAVRLEATLDGPYPTLGAGGAAARVSGRVIGRVGEAVGLEWTRVRITGTAYSRVKLVEESREFFRREVDVDVRGDLAPGDYDAPYELVLQAPENLAPSFSFGRQGYKNKYEANVTWTVEVLVRPKGWFRSTRSVWKGVLDVFGAERPELVPVRSVFKLDQGFGWFKSSGTLSVVGKAGDGTALPGDRVEFALFVHNKSNVAISLLGVKLTEQVVLKAGSSAVRQITKAWDLDVVHPKYALESFGVSGKAAMDGDNPGRPLKDSEFAAGRETSLRASVILPLNIDHEFFVNDLVSVHYVLTAHLRPRAFFGKSLKFDLPVAIARRPHSLPQNSDHVRVIRLAQHTNLPVAIPLAEPVPGPPGAEEAGAICEAEVVACT